VDNNILRIDRKFGDGEYYKCVDNYCGGCAILKIVIVVMCKLHHHPKHDVMTLN